VYDLSDGFPLLTTKKVNWRAVAAELLWFIEGSTDERRLAEILHGTRDTSKQTIWTGNANDPLWVDRAKFPGDLGPIYGYQWRSWPTASGDHIDQLAQLVAQLKTNPYSRRHILSAWNVGQIPDMALPPCHAMAQFYVEDIEDGRKGLSCQLYQRSADFFLGVPFNIASYALLTSMIAQVCGYIPAKLIHITGDAHIYIDHLDRVNTQLSREPYSPPQLILNPSINNITDFSMADIDIVGYVSHGALPAHMSV
jgi:thymidylate synthase